MTDFLTSIRMDLTGNVVRRAKQYQNSIHQFSRRGQRDMGMMRRSTAAVGRGLDRMGNRYTGMLTGAAAVGTANWVMKLERRFTRLGIQANKTEADMEKLKEQIFETSRAPAIRIDPSELTASVEEIIERTGDLDFARNNLENFALAIGATGAAGKDIGGIAAEFQKMGIIDPKEVREALDILTTQGKEGAFTLQKLANLGPRVVTAYTAMGRQGLPAIREMGAALQVIMRGTGDAERAATTFEAMLRVLSDPKKTKMLQQGGIQVFDVEALKEGREILRPINELMEEIVTKAKGRKSIIQPLFGDEAARGFNDIVGEFNKTGSITMLDRFMDLQANGNLIPKDAARAANDAAAALQSIFTSLKKFADDKLAEPFKDMADLLDKLGNERTDTALTVGATVAGGALAAFGARKLMKLGKGLGLGSAAATAAAEVAPNYLNNLYGSGKPKLSLAARSARMMWPAAGVLASGAAGYGVGTLINEKFIRGTEFQHTLGESIAKALAFFGNDEAKAAVATNAKVDVVIKVDSEGRVQVPEASSDNKDVNLDLDVGMMMGG